MKQDRPANRISEGDRWYTDSHFRAQMRTSGRRRVIENRWRVYKAMIAAWLVERGESTSFTLLDAGCGDGLNLVGLKQMARSEGWQMRVRAIDYNPLRAERARAYAPDVPVQRASLYAVPYRTNSFDVVLCSHVLEHVPDLGAALSELARVLKSRGLLIVGVPNEGCTMGRLRNRVLQRHILRTTDHVHFFTEGALRDRLVAAGFQVRSVERETFFFPLSYINVLCTEFSVGHSLMTLLRTWFPSQAGGLITALQNG